MPETLVKAKSGLLYLKSRARRKERHAEHSPVGGGVCLSRAPNLVEQVGGSIQPAAREILEKKFPPARKAKPWHRLVARTSARGCGFVARDLERVVPKALFLIKPKSL